MAPGIDLSCDIRQGLGLPDGSIDYAVSVHALQEIPYDDLGPVLGELRRVLTPGGVLRLVLPDLIKGVRAYARGDRGYFLVPDEDARSLGSKLIVQMLWYGYSRLIFTEDFIEEQLVKAGFRQVVRCAYRETASRFSEIVSLDNRERESLFVEATK
jgi:predicted SAM-dependent methyltransferase